MNDLVYPVHGGMEDWAYATSWDPKHTSPCQPSTYGGYDTSRTVYDEYVLRCFNMLVETSDNKIPNSHLGSSSHLLSDAPKSNGHVTRNLRLALAALEMVQPYVFVEKVNSMKLLNDDWKCRHVSVPSNQSAVALDWVVGGSIHIHEVQIYHRLWSKTLSGQYCDTEDGIILDDTQSDWQNGTTVSPLSGTVDLSSYNSQEEIAVVVRIRVDQQWRGKSHIVNARTNPSYRAEHNGFKIHGTLDWYSMPLLIHLDSTTTQELYVRYDPNYTPKDTGGNATAPPRQFPTPNGASNSKLQPSDGKNRPSEAATFSGWFIVAVIVVVVGAFATQRILRSLFRQNRREQVRNFISDKRAITPGLNGYEDIPTGGEVDLPEIA